MHTQISLGDVFLEFQYGQRALEFRTRKGQKVLKHARTVTALLYKKTSDPATDVMLASGFVVTHWKDRFVKHIGRGRAWQALLKQIPLLEDRRKLKAMYNSRRSRPSHALLLPSAAQLLLTQ